jgi:glycosyltransferase involved in cell wall biosynthesis
LIVGDGAELQNIRGMASRSRLQNVWFTGLVPRARVPGLLAASDIALVTLRPTEVFKTVLPSKMFEAMAAGVPIVLAVEGEARATLERAHAGLPVQPGNAAALASAILHLASDGQARARMGAAGAVFVEQEFSRRKWAERYLDVLSHLVARELGDPVGEFPTLERIAQRPASVPRSALPSRRRETRLCGSPK